MMAATDTDTHVICLTSGELTALGVFVALAGSFQEGNFSDCLNMSITLHRLGRVSPDDIRMMLKKMAVATKALPIMGEDDV